MEKKNISGGKSSYVIPGVVRTGTDGFAWIDDIVAREFGIEKYQIHWRTKERIYVVPRQVCMWWRKNNTKDSLKTIGQRYGFTIKYDHATVLNACRTIENLIYSDMFFRNQIERVCNEADIYRRKIMPETVFLRCINHIVKEVDEASAVTDYIVRDDYRTLADMALISIGSAVAQVIEKFKV
jgi:hypothetical protein